MKNTWYQAFSGFSSPCLITRLSETKFLLKQLFILLLSTYYITESQRQTAVSLTSTSEWKPSKGKLLEGCKEEGGKGRVEILRVEKGKWPWFYNKKVWTNFFSPKNSSSLDKVHSTLLLLYSIYYKAIP